MPSVKRRASKILNEYGATQSELIGKAVVLTDGKAGTVENVWLDELHGLRISIDSSQCRLEKFALKLTLSASLRGRETSGPRLSLVTKEESYEPDIELLFSRSTYRACICRFCIR